MSAHQREERLRSPRLSIPDWSGSLNCSDVITGNLLSPATSWRLNLTGTMVDRGLIYLSAMFDGPLRSNDTFPGSVEEEIAKQHEGHSENYVSLWVGDIRSLSLKEWSGALADHYGCRLMLTGKAQGGGVISLRAMARIEGQKPDAKLLDPVKITRC